MQQLYWAALCADAGKNENTNVPSAASASSGLANDPSSVETESAKKENVVTASSTASFSDSSSSSSVEASSTSGEDSDDTFLTRPHDVIRVEDDVPKEKISVYEDEYLRYEVPSSWEYAPEYSSEEQMFAFFVPKNGGERPSNINVYINSLNSQSTGFDYSDPEVQDEYKLFMHQGIGTQLPAEAIAGEFRVFQFEDYYAYALTYNRQLEEDIEVTQTVCTVMGLPYAITVTWTDWGDEATPSAELAALHVINTLSLKVE